MKQWDKTKNGDIDPGKLRPNSNMIVHWSCSDPVCKCPHEWPARIADRTHAKCPTDCPFCATPPLKVCIHNSLEYNYPELANEWNTNKNGDLKPSEVSTKSNRNIWWICSINHNHQWDTIIYSRTDPDHPTGCPFCRKKTEGDLLKWLIEQLPDHTIEPQQTFDWCCGPTTNRELPYDFYIVELNRLIELDGPQHFEDINNWKPFKETRKNDIYKMKLALEHDIAVIRITQTMFKKRKAEMKDILLPHILNEELNYVFLSDGNEYRNHKAMLTKALKSAK